MITGRVEGPVCRARRRGHPPPTGAEDKKPFVACLFFCLLIQSVRSLRACLLMFSASPATAAMEICCVWWTTKEEALADAAPYTVVRSVLVGAHRFLKKEIKSCTGFVMTPANQ